MEIDVTKLIVSTLPVGLAGIEVYDIMDGNGVIEPGTFLDFKLTDLGQRNPNLVEKLLGAGRRYAQLRQLATEACK